MPMDTQEAIPVPWRDVDGYHCFGCAPDNPAGLALVAHEIADGLSCRFLLDRRHESYPGIVHGGIVTTILDELMGNVLALRERSLSFTVTLRVRFVAPLHTGRRYHASARIVRRSGSLSRMEAKICDDADATLVLATGTYQALTAEQARRQLAIGSGGLAPFGRYFKSAKEQESDGRAGRYHPRGRVHGAQAAVPPGVEYDQSAGAPGDGLGEGPPHHRQDRARS
jgi:uncharacterized protein (TIGR00369 family)